VIVAQERMDLVGPALSSAWKYCTVIQIYSVEQEVYYVYFYSLWLAHQYKATFPSTLCCSKPAHQSIVMTHSFFTLSTRFVRPTSRVATFPRMHGMQQSFLEYGVTYSVCPLASREGSYFYNKEPDQQSRPKRIPVVFRHLSTSITILF
jgi:hypothetical protein